MTRPPTMLDVARAAGVSRSTVSRVFQNQGERVSHEALIKVHEAARRLGYVHNLVASGLAMRHGRQLGLLIRDAPNPAYGHLHSEVHQATEQAGRTLISVTALGHAYGTEEVDGLRRLLGQRVAGVFVGTGVTAAEDLVETVTTVPMMIVGRPNTHPRIESVSYDERAHGRLVAERLFEAGHRRVAVLSGPLLYSRVFDLRVRSLQERCRELGIHTRTVDLLPVEEGVGRALDLAAAEELTAIACPVDYVALELLRAARARSVDVPGQVSVVGFDGMADGLDLIGLATVQLPVREVAQQAVTRMEELLVRAQDDHEGPPGEAEEPVRHTLVAGRFVPGATLGTAPATSR